MWLFVWLQLCLRAAAAGGAHGVTGFVSSLVRALLGLQRVVHCSSCVRRCATCRCARTLQQQHCLFQCNPCSAQPARRVSRPSLTLGNSSPWTAGCSISSIANATSSSSSALALAASSQPRVRHGCRALQGKAARCTPRPTAQPPRTRLPQGRCRSARCSTSASAPCRWCGT